MPGSGPPLRGRSSPGRRGAARGRDFASACPAWGGPPRPVSPALKGGKNKKKEQELRGESDPDGQESAGLSGLIPAWGEVGLQPGTAQGGSEGGRCRMSSRHGAGASGLARWAMLQLKGGFQGCGCPRRVPVIPVRVAVPRVGSTKPARLRGSGSFTRPCRRRPHGQQGEGRGKTGPWGPPAGRLRVPICGGRRG